MKKTLCVKLFLMVFLLNSSWLYAEDVWRDNFAEETGKGYWGGGSDMAGIIDWTLSTENCSLTDESDYIKVISTSGGRLEAKDCDGEAIGKPFLLIFRLLLMLRFHYMWQKRVVLPMLINISSVFTNWMEVMKYLLKQIPKI